MEKYVIKKQMVNYLGALSLWESIVIQTGQATFTSVCIQFNLCQWTSQERLLTDCGYGDTDY